MNFSIGTLNVGTLNGKLEGPYSLLEKFMDEQCLDILCLQETQKKSCLSISEQKIGDRYTLYYSGWYKEKWGVGICVRDKSWFNGSPIAVRHCLEKVRRHAEALQKFASAVSEHSTALVQGRANLEVCTHVTTKLLGEFDDQMEVYSRIISLEVTTSGQTYEVVSVYAPTSSRSANELDEFWNVTLADQLYGLTHGQLIVAGDFNVSLGRESSNSLCRGKYTYGRTQGGRRLVSLAERYNLAIMNSFFYKKDIDRLITYESGDNQTQIDYILMPQSQMQLVGDCQTYVVDANMATQHRLLMTRPAVEEAYWETPQAQSAGISQLTQSVGEIHLSGQSHASHMARQGEAREGAYTN